MESRFDINFKAKLVSKWGSFNKYKNDVRINIISFEKEDVCSLESLYDEIKISTNHDSYKKDIIESSIKTILEILNYKYKKILEKVKLYGAVYEGEICGLLVANIPKTRQKSSKIIYSSRHNSAKKETEIDWLVTWMPMSNNQLKGVGKSLVGQYFLTLKQDGFRDVFVKSELPENSYAQFFYENLGFEKLGDKRTRLMTKTSSQCLIKDFSNNSDVIIPMIATKNKIRITINKLKQEMKPLFIDKIFDPN
jgi:hypothetical protein